MTPHSHAYIAANAIIVKEEKILLMRRSKTDAFYANHWGLAGGMIDWNETGEAATIREVKEEIGVDVEIDRFVGYLNYTPHPHYEMVITLTYYTHIVSGTPYAAQPEECEEVKWFNLSDIREMNLAFDHKEILIKEKLI